MTQYQFMYEHKKWNLLTEKSCVCLLCKVMVCTFIYRIYAYFIPLFLCLSQLGAIFHGQIQLLASKKGIYSLVSLFDLSSDNTIT
jgi:hypothetical protein